MSCKYLRKDSDWIPALGYPQTYECELELKGAKAEPTDGYDCSYDGCSDYEEARDAD